MWKKKYKDWFLYDHIRTSSGERLSIPSPSPNPNVIPALGEAEVGRLLWVQGQSGDSQQNPVKKKKKHVDRCQEFVFEIFLQKDQTRWLDLQMEKENKTQSPLKSGNEYVTSFRVIYFKYFYRSKIFYIIVIS